MRDFSLTVLKMRVKSKPFFLSYSLLHYYSDFWYYRSLLCYGKFKKNWEKIRTNYEQYTLKIMKILRTALLGFSFTSSYKKVSVIIFQINL